MLLIKGRKRATPAIRCDRERRGSPPNLRPYDSAAVLQVRESTALANGIAEDAGEQKQYAGRGHRKSGMQRHHSLIHARARQPDKNGDEHDHADQLDHAPILRERMCDSSMR